MRFPWLVPRAEKQVPVPPHSHYRAPVAAHLCRRSTCDEIPMIGAPGKKASAHLCRRSACDEIPVVGAPGRKASACSSRQPLSRDSGRTLVPAVRVVMRFPWLVPRAEKQVPVPPRSHYRAPVAAH